MFAAGTSVVFDEAEVSVSVFSVCSVSRTIIVAGPKTVPEAMASVASAEMIGAVFPPTAFATVSVNAVALVLLPSLTVSVTVATPLCPAAGARETVRFAPLPPNAIPAAGSSVLFELPAVSVREAAEVSASPTVNAIPFTAAPGVVR
jgi:hypothetical protein